MPQAQNFEYKSLNIAIKSFDKIKGIFKGYASSFNQVDKVNDTMSPEAFDNSINQFENKSISIPINYDHFREIELAANLISMSKDDYGLLVEFQVSEDAKSTYSELYANMILNCEIGKLFMSIGGYIIKSNLGEDRWIKKMVANANDTIFEFELDHIAVTEWPIDSNAKMLEVKSRVEKKSEIEDFSNLNRLLQIVDGEVSAIKYLSTHKSNMSNTNAKNFVFHLKSIFKKELDNNVKELRKSIIEIPSSESQGQSNASMMGSKNGISLKDLAKHLK